jgi:outer membrane protein X
MKKVCLLLAFGTILSLSSFAQGGYKPFKVGVDLGYAIPSGSGAKGGVLFAIEPKYAVASAITVGLRIEGAVMARGYVGVNDDAGSADLDVKASGSYLLTGDYYFTNNHSFRPFSGIGTGIYSIAAASMSGDGGSGSGEVSVGGGSKFGGLIRTGFEAGHFRLGLEYNLVPKTSIIASGGSGSGETKIESKNSYMGIKIGVLIGGGKKGK